MAYDGWVDFAGRELFNLARVSQLAEALGVDMIWTDPDDVAWIETALSGLDYDDITTAPWYDANYPASAEFAGVLPLSMVGLDDSTLTSTVTEYNTDGGNSGRPRNSTKSIVAEVALVASTDRGAEYGKRWLDRLLRGSGTPFAACTGFDLTYFRWEGSDSDTPPKAHYRNVRLTRGTSVTSKRRNECSSVWLVTFTFTAADPFEYGEPVEVFTGLGDAFNPSQPYVTGSGSDALVYTPCPVYDYTPIFDPQNPALVPSPTAPDLTPERWGLVEGVTIQRYWAEVSTPEVSTLGFVPFVEFSTLTDARTVRLSVWPAGEDTTSQCGAMWSVVMTFMPGGLASYLDGEQRAAYAWDGFSPNVRRMDSVVFGPTAGPVDWPVLESPSGFLIALDLFASTDSVGYVDSGDLGSDGFPSPDVEVTFSLVPRSD